MTHNGGLAQANFWFPSPFNDHWAINACKMQLALVGVGASDSNWPSLINDRGYPTAMPSGGGAYWASSQLYIYGSAGTVWTLDWTGTATFTLVPNDGGTITPVVIGSNEIEFTIGGSPSHTFDGQPGNSWLVSLRITAMTGAVSNIRLYRKDHKSLINGTGATSKFTPEFLDRVSGIGVIRFMDWTACNASRMVKWADRNLEADLQWSGNRTKASWFFGTATDAATLNRWLLPSALPTLTNGQIVQFIMPARPAPLVIDTVTSGTVTTFTSASPHGLVNGDKISAVTDSVSGGYVAPMTTRVAPTGLCPLYPVTVTSTTQFTIALNSTGFAAPTGGKFNVWPHFRITDGTVIKDCNGAFTYYNSSWGGTYPRLMSAVYSSAFDCFFMNGDNNGDIIATGVPVEVMIELCNHIRCHPYFNYPHIVEDAWWTGVATIVRDTLLPALTPRFATGNEIWNTGNSFVQTRYAESNALRLYGSLSSNLDYARRVKEVQPLIHAVFGTSRPYIMVFEGQAVGGVPASRAEGNATINPGGSPAGYPINCCDELAYGPYVLPPFTYSTAVNTYPGFLDAVDDWVTGADIDGAFDWLKNEFITPTVPAFSAGNTDQALDGYIAVQHPKWTLAATTYTGRQGSLAVNHYEGGNGVPGYGGLTRGGLPANATSGHSITATDVMNFYLAYLASAQSAEFMREYLTRMKAAGVLYPSQYVLTGGWGASATWGAQKMNDVAGAVTSPTPQFTEFKLWNNAKRRLRITT